MSFGLPNAFAPMPHVNLPGPPAQANAEYWRSPASFIGGNDNLSNNDNLSQGLANGTATLAYPLRPPPDNEEIKDDVGKCELMFMKCNSAAFSRELVHRYQPRTLSRMNWWLRKPEMCKEWGSQFSALKLLQDWAFVGVANTDLTDFGGSDRTNKKMSNAVSIHKLGRVTVPDIWLSCGRKAVNGDVLYLLVVKCVSSPSFGKDVDNDIKFATSEADEGVTTDQCWQFLPWIGVMGRGPPPALYTTPHWHGACLRLGTVTDRVFNPENMVESNRQLALQCTCPSTPNAEYRDAINSLPIVVIQLGL